MKKIVVLLLIAHSFLFSQRFSHSLHAAGPQYRSLAAGDTLNILAVMVQFQTDTDDRSSGNGQFDLGASSAPIIDAPPHDSAYFADHFLFAQNYFRKASNGKQHIKAAVLGTVITLPKQMKEYAPINGNLPLAKMIEDVWKKADTLYPGFPFATYDLFVVFHAGVGKDVDLRAALGYDPTPYDLPSLYFNLTAFKNVFGTSFDGIPVQNSNFKIPNSIVLPETEVRKIPSVGGDIVLKLGMNGLLVASIASHLGLPDLFDTETGRTAIGRFGLMDGQSIFSFSGICPPEPSAWEKSYMGWTTPIEVYGNKTLSLPAVSLYETGSDTIYKIPISAKEYFLVENRQRDANKNSQTVTMKWNGQIATKTFSRDEDFYSNTNIDSIYGVVLDVDELDWSLPGLINANNDYHGGILVWHIDETIIEKNLASNSINADPVKRGVDVEEADGSQDIGQTYDFVSPGSGSEDGSPIDYWFSGNPSPVYKNEFSETTNPNSLSNSFAKSHITLKNFSASLPRMTFEANVGSANIQLLKVIKRSNLKLDNNDAPIAADLNGDGKEELIYTSGDSIYVLKDDLTPYLNNATGLFYPKGGQFQPAFFASSITGNPFRRGIIGVSDSTIYLLTLEDTNLDSVADIYRSINVGDMITTPVTAREIESMGQFMVGTKSGKYVVVDTTTVVSQLFSSPIVSVSSIAIASSDSLYLQGTYLNSERPIQSVVSAGFVASNKFYFIVQTGSTIATYDFNTQQKVGEFFLPIRPTTTLTPTYLNNDGSVDIILGSGDKLFAYNVNGSVIDNFPFTVHNDSIFGGIIVVDDAIVFGTVKGLFYALDYSGKTLPGFPFQTGGMVSAPFVTSDRIIVASTDTSLSVWKHSNILATQNTRWLTFLGSVSHNAGIVTEGRIKFKSSELLPKSFAYNWPNPVYDNKTNIRYFLGKSATVKIKIINMAGELVDELTGTNFVGLDNEVQWDVSKIQSGIYFAQITASGSGGEQSQIIKIAVVK
ncbi:MAG: T9SS type A sorting domain-containing protein [Bacteroidota bacterium]